MGALTCRLLLMGQLGPLPTSCSARSASAVHLKGSGATVLPISRTYEHHTGTVSGSCICVTMWLPLAAQAQWVSAAPTACWPCMLLDAPSA
jgi:hypothetical protein